MARLNGVNKENCGKRNEDAQREERKGRKKRKRGKAKTRTWQLKEKKTPTIAV